MGSSKKQTSKSQWNSTNTNDALDRYKPDYNNAHDQLNNTIKDRQDQGIYQGDRIINDFNDQTNNAIKDQQDVVNQNAHTLNDLSDMRDGKINPYFQANSDNMVRQQRNSILNDNAINGMGNSDNSRVVSRELSNCFIADTLIQMADGSQKKIQDITVGDKVIGLNSEVREVLQTHKGYDQTYKVSSLLDNETYTVSSNHILTLNQHNKIKFISAEDYFNISKTSKYQYFKIKQGYEFKESNLPIDPYYIGLWLGDGAWKEPNRITNKDEEIISYLNDMVDDRHYVVSTGHHIHQACKDYYYPLGLEHFIVNSKPQYPNKINEAFRELGLILNSKEEKHIPEIIFKSSRDQRKRLLAGLIDSDGSKIIDSKNGYMFTQCKYHKRLVLDTVRLIDSLGYSRNYREKDVLSIRINVGKDEILPVLLPRKQGKLSEQNTSSVSIIKSDIETVYGITVDGDQLILLGNGIITHNSQNAFIINNIMIHKREDFKAQAQELEAAKTQSGLLNNSMNASGKKDALEQMKLDANKEKYEEGRDWNLDNLGKYIEGLKGIDSGFGTQTSQGTGKMTNQIKGSGLDGILSGLGSAASIGSSVASMFSDDRIKSFIKETKETTKDGIPIKTFEYKSDALPDGKFKGVMASDVEKIKPEAITIEPKTGLKTVDYDLLGTVLKRIK